MKCLKIVLPLAAALLLFGQAAAQEAEYEIASEIEARDAEFAQQMLEAEERLAEAAQQVAELSRERLGALGEAKGYAYEFKNKPRLGINIGSDDNKEPVEGVGIISVSPGSAADDAGLRVGDIITSVNGVSLTAESSHEANMRLLDFIKGVEEGDQLDIEYLRDGNIGTVQVEPRVVEQDAFVWHSRGPNFTMPNIEISPQVMEKFRFSFGGWRGGWGDMEVVELTEGLGRYFGVDSGLLVISAPESNAFKLQEGDVIQSIDGRAPTSVNHCMRILGSYQPGEKLVLNIMRDKRRQTIEIEIPDDRTSRLSEPRIELAKPARVPVPRPAPAMEERT